jgi:hypothetical protein
MNRCQSVSRSLLESLPPAAARPASCRWLHQRRMLARGWLEGWMQRRRHRTPLVLFR